MSEVVYRFFDEAGDLLYVGVSANFSRRSAQHRAEKEWWPEVASHTLETHPTRWAAEIAERAAIYTERPKHNVAEHPTHRPRLARRRLHDGPLMGAHEIAEYVGVSRQRVTDLAKTSAFPRPAARLRAGAVWRTEDVLKWAETTGRKIHE